MYILSSGQKPKEKYFDDSQTCYDQPKQIWGIHGSKRTQLSYLVFAKLNLTLHIVKDVVKHHFIHLSHHSFVHLSGHPFVPSRFVSFDKAEKEWNTEGLHNYHLFLSTAQFLYYMMRKRITSRDMIGCKACTGSVTLSSL